MFINTNDEIKILTNEQCFDYISSSNNFIDNWSHNKLKEIGEEYLYYRKDLKNILKHLIIPELSDIIIKYV